MIVVSEFIQEGCDGESEKILVDVCMKLPNEDCIPHPYMNLSRCGEDEFDCGDGKCIPGLDICDNKYQCTSGADEVRW